MKIKLTYNLGSVSAETKRIMRAELEDRKKKVVSSLQQVTPVDTGLARDSWESTDVVDLNFEINNKQDYVKYLNRGSSDQAPAFFVEATVLKYGDPAGVIVEYPE